MMTFSVLFISFLFQLPDVHAQLPPSTQMPSLNYRGQGHSSLCNAFAEEQLLKDFICQKNCDSNALKWEFSIFDLSKAHALKSALKLDTLIKGTKAENILDVGTPWSFPFSDMGVTSVRQSRCTLERDIFKINRSVKMNPELLTVSKLLARLYSEFRSKSAPKLTLKSKSVVRTWKTLEELALKSSNEDLFLNQVINYSTCNDRMSIPEFKAHQINPNDLNAMKASLVLHLKREKSILVRLCGTTLQTESNYEPDCNSHSIVLKSVNEVIGQNGSPQYEVLVIDSAFLSPRALNGDGSVWVPLSVILTAIKQSEWELLYLISTLKRNIELPPNSPSAITENQKILALEASVKNMLIWLE